MNTQRLLGWSAFLGIAALLTWAPDYFFGQGDGASDSALAVAPRSQVAKPASATAAKARPTLAAVDLFASKSWKPAAVLASVTEQAVIAAPVEVTAVAPALPFQVVGRLNDRDDQQVFLQNGEKLYVVRRGDVIEDTYRIEQISATELSLVYLPLHLSQTLSVGSAP